MDISFYDWHYFGVYLQTPMIPTDTHSRVIGITLPQSTYKFTNTLTPFGLWRTRIIHSVLVRGESGIRTRGSVKISGFQDRCNKPTLPSLLIVVPQGFEPQFHGPKPCVLPIRRGNNNETNMSKNFFFWGLYQVRTDDSGLQSRDITNYTKRPIFWV